MVRRDSEVGEGKDREDGVKISEMHFSHAVPTLHFFYSFPNCLHQVNTNSNQFTPNSTPYENNRNSILHTHHHPPPSHFDSRLYRHRTYSFPVLRRWMRRVLLCSFWLLCECGYIGGEEVW